MMSSLACQNATPSTLPFAGAVCNLVAIINKMGPTHLSACMCKTIGDLGEGKTTF